MTFHRSSVEGFVMTTSKPLGELSYLRIWHDNTGDLTIQVFDNTGDLTVQVICDNTADL